MTFKLKSGFAVGSTTVVDSNSYFQQTESSASIPPSLVLDFTSKVLDPRITFSRSSNATFVGSNGLIQTTTANIPRFEHDPITRQCRGILMEEQRTNLLLYSEQIDNAVWGKGEITITSNTVTAPDGTLTADKVVESTTAASYHFINQGITKPATSNSYTYSLYAKDAGRAVVGLRISSAGNGAVYAIDLSDGTIQLAAGVYGTGFSNPIGIVANAGNGWYKISLTVTTDTDTTIYVQNYLYNKIAGSSVYTGDGTSGVYIWGAQFELGYFATNYIPTVASTVTRIQDDAKINYPLLTSVINPEEGTIVTEFESKSPMTGGQAVAFNRYPVPFIIAGSTATNVLWYGSAAETYIGGTYNNFGAVPSGVNKLAVAVANGQCGTSLNGNAVVSRSGNRLTSDLSYLGIGSANGSGVSVLGGTIKNLTYYPKRLSNTTIINLTSS